MPSDELIDAVMRVDNTLARYDLRTYSELVDQLADLAEAAIKHDGKLEAEIIRLEAEIFKLIGAKPHTARTSRAASGKC